MRARQKVLVALLLHALGRPTRTQLMKWLFLLRQETSFYRDSTFYDFVPYHYGPFSFDAYRELDALAQCGFIGPSGLGIPPHMRGQAAQLEASLAPDARRAVRQTLRRYGNLQTSNLLDLVYHHYPWYASRSRRPLPGRHPLPGAPPKQALAPCAVYTIGYQGKSVDAFLNQLLLSGIKTLVDVRGNPVSRKYGFSSRSLAQLLRHVGISYAQFPGPGVDAAFRKSVGSRLTSSGCIKAGQPVRLLYEATNDPKARFLCDATNSLVAIVRSWYNQGSVRV
jgi:hypothetical protein